MKHKLWIILLTVLMIICFCFGLSACETSNLDNEEKYTVFFIVDNEVYSSVKTNGDETITLPANPSKNGFIFDGWFYDNGIWSKTFNANSLVNNSISADISVYAKFSEDEPIKGTDVVIDGYTLINDESLGEVYYLKVPNSTLIYTLEGVIHTNKNSKWIISTDVYGRDEIPSRTVALIEGNNVYYLIVTDSQNNTKFYTLLIHRTRIFTVTFTYGFIKIDEQKVEEGNLAKIPDVPAMEGYTTMWTGSVILPIEKDETFDLYYVANKYSISYDANGGRVSPSKQEVTYDDNYTLATPTRDGYTFDGWYYKNEKITNGNWTIAEDVTLTARWIGKNYSISYDLNGGINNYTNPNRYTAGATITLSDPSKTGYTFLGWTGNGISTPTKNLQIKSSDYGDKTFTANWSANTYDVTFDAAGGQCSTLTTKFTYDSFITLPVPTRTDYDFVGWYNGTTKVENGTWKIADNCTLTAKWELKRFSIKYELNGGENNSLNPNAYTKETEVTLFDPTRTGYSFTGWTTDGITTPTMSVKIEKGSVGAKTFTAHWEANTYIATFDATGGICDIETQDFIFDESCSLPTPTRIGYTFEGWYYNNSKVNYVWNIAQDCTLTAKWSANTDTVYIVNHYQENADDDNYTLYATQNLTGTSDSLVTPEVNTYEGFTSPDRQTVSVGPDGSLVVDYYYTRNYYTISFITNGGQQISEISKKYQSTSSLPNGVRKNYTFGGWFTDIELANSFDPSEMEAKDQTVYAWWCEENKPTDFTYSGTIAITVSGYTGNSDTLWIPSYIGNIAVTSISASAFVNHLKVTKVVVPETVIKIGSGVFKDCNALEDITLPFVGSSVDSTSALSYIFGTVPKTLKTVRIIDDDTIPDNAFSGLNQLKEVWLPKTSTSIGSYAFQNCDGLLRLNSETDGEFNIPVGVVVISSYAFSGCSLVENVTVGDITSIGSYAFSGCSLLLQFNSENAEEIIIPEGVTSIGSYSFQDVSLVTKVVVPETVGNLGKGVFQGCNAIEEITLPFVGHSLTAKNHDAVFGYIFGQATTYTHSGYLNSPNTNYVNKQIDNVENTVWQYSSYDGAEYRLGRWQYNLTSYYYYIPESIKKVVITVQTDIPVAVFNNCSFIETIYIPNEVTSIGGYAFQNCLNLRRLNSEQDGLYNLPKSLVELNNYAFYSNAMLEKVTVGSKIVNIGNYVFSGCNSLSEFNSNNGNELIIPNGITSIGKYAFQNVLLVTKVVVSDTVESIGVGAFNGCNSVEEITVPQSGIKNILGTVPATLKKVTLTKVTTIDGNAFSNLKNIEEIIIPEDITTIGAYAFQNCSSLKRLNSDIDGVYNIPNGVRNIENYTFSGCGELTKIILDSLVSIGNYAFSGCSLLSQFNSEKASEIIIPNGVTSIGNHAFQNVSLVTKVVVPDTVNSIGAGAFEGCNSIEELRLPFVGNSLTAKNFDAVFGYIFGYEAIEDTGWHVELSNTFVNTRVDGLSGIWQYSCYNGERYPVYGEGYFNKLRSYYYNIPTTLKTVTITVQTDIPVAAFNNCSFIETINLPYSVEEYGSIGQYAFQSCSATINYSVIPTLGVPWDGVTMAKQFNGGSGTQEDPYIIFNGAQLAYFAQQVNSGVDFNGVYFALGSDIDLNNKVFPVIGATEGTAFSGIFDGKGFVIKNLFIANKGQYTGLFGYCNGIVKSLGLYSGTINASFTENATAYAGSLVGYLNGTVENCYAATNLTANFAYIGYAGGLVGANTGTIRNCYVSGNVICNSSNFMAYAGGLVGDNSGVLTGCFAYGNVTAKGSAEPYSRNGGLVGFVGESSTITDCYRYEGQVLTKYVTVGNSYCNEGTVASPEAIIVFCQENWDRTVWQFEGNLPTLISL